jgi:hypothetical protein
MPANKRHAVEGMGGEDAGGIAAEAEEGRVAEGHQSAKAKRDVEPDGGERQDRDARRQRDVERLAHWRTRRAGLASRQQRQQSC